MRFTKSREWLDRLLSGEVPSEVDLRQMVAECAKEDQHLDYKSGKLTDPADTLREYVAAFANSDGGTLLIGYDLASKAFDGMAAPGGASLEEWATRSIFALTPYLSPAPRIASPTVSGKPVLLVATARAPRLVPVVQKGELVYFLRIGESNFAAPPFLLSDLVLGRRNHPVLRPRLSGASLGLGRDVHCPNVEGTLLNINVVIENTSLVFAEDVRCGLILWSTPDAASRVQDGLSVPDSLKANLDISQPPHFDSQEIQPPWLLTHARLSRHAVAGLPPREPPLDIGPFDETPDQALRPVVLPVFSNMLAFGPPAAAPSSPFYEHTRYRRIQTRGAVEAKGALYLLSRDAEPWWFQFGMRYDKALLRATQEDPLKLMQLTPVMTPRPVVSFDFYAPDGETF